MAATADHQLPDSPLDELLTMEEAGAILRISRASIYRLTTDKRLEYTKHGRARMTTRRWINEFIDRSRVPARAS